jgi:hypothetical protein
MVPPKRLTHEEQSGRERAAERVRCGRRGRCNKSGRLEGSSANWMFKMQTCTYATWAKEAYKEKETAIERAKIKRSEQAGHKDFFT